MAWATLELKIITNSMVYLRAIIDACIYFIIFLNVIQNL